MGRTGIAGRGLFGRWGPNHVVHVVVTRWAVLNLCRSAPTFPDYFALLRVVLPALLTE